MSSIPRPPLQRNAPCPCGSGRKTKKCLLAAEHGVHPPHASVFPAPPRTGRSLEKCYLAGLEDCSEKLTREHVQTRSILEALAGRAVVTSGGVGQEPGDVSIRGIDSLTARVLCDRHNAALSPLDKAGLGLLEAQLRLGRLTTGEHPIGEIDSFHDLLNGHTLERWAAKNLLGMIASSAVRYRGDRVKDYAIPREWIDVLMGTRTLEPPHGLYFRSDPADDAGLITTLIPDYGVRPLWDDRTATIVGVQIRLAGFDYVLWLDTERRGLRPDLAAYVYRPPKMYGRRQRLTGTVEFSWEIRGASSIEVSRHACLPPGHQTNTSWHHWGEPYEKTVDRYSEGGP